MSRGQDQNRGLENLGARGSTPPRYGQMSVQDFADLVQTGLEKSDISRYVKKR